MMSIRIDVLSALLMRVRRTGEMKTMKWVRLWMAGAALAATAGSAAAFEEQRVGVTPGQKAPPAMEAPAGGASQGLTPEAAAPKEPTGKDMRFPGWDKLKILPKFDFGLELLYGANESKRPDDERSDSASEGVGVRGKLKF